LGFKRTESRGVGIQLMGVQEGGKFLRPYPLWVSPNRIPLPPSHNVASSGAATRDDTGVPYTTPRVRYPSTLCCHQHPPGGTFCCQQTADSSVALPYRCHQSNRCYWMVPMDGVSGWCRWLVRGATSSLRRSCGGPDPCGPTDPHGLRPYVSTETYGLHPYGPTETNGAAAHTTPQIHMSRSPSVSAET